MKTKTEEILRQMKEIMPFKLSSNVEPYVLEALQIQEHKNKELIEANTKECKWVFEEDECWESQCRQSFIFNDKGPIFNGFKYCPYCGGKMIQNENEN